MTLDALRLNDNIMKLLRKYFIDPITERLLIRYPGLRFVKDYSPKVFERREILWKIMNFVEECGVEGDYLEFGVYKGRTFISAIKAAQKKSLYRMQFYAFDSFHGLPKPEGVDTDSDQFHEGELAYSLEEFKKVLRARNTDFSKIHIVPGFYKDTLTPETKKQLPLKAAAVVWVDCDLYDSTVPVLDFVKEYLVDGTIVVLDDWFFYKGHPKRGERKAFSEWLEKNSEFSASEFNKYAWHGNSFIIHKDQ